MNIEHVFENHTKSLFKYLVDSFGFKEPTIMNESSYGYFAVIYELESLVIKIYFQHRGAEVGINFGRIISDNVVQDDYSFHMFLGIVNPNVHYKLGGSMVSSQDELVEILEIYASSLKRDGLSILNNDDIAFKKIKEANASGKGLCVPHYMQLKKGKITSKFNGEE